MRQVCLVVIKDAFKVGWKGGLLLLLLLSSSQH